MKVAKFPMDYNSVEAKLMDQKDALNTAAQGKTIHTFAVDNEFIYVFFDNMLPLKQRQFFVKVVNHEQNLAQGVLENFNVVHVVAKNDVLIGLVEAK